MLRILFVACTLAVLAGCATSDRLAGSQAMPKAGTGYVAGRFRLDHYPFVTAFVLSDGVSGSEYVLPFTARRNFDDGNDETTLIEVPPGSYRVKQWIVFNVNFGPTKGWGREFTADMKESVLSRPFEVKAGQVLFLGSFVGNTTWTPGFTSVTHGRWTGEDFTFADAKRTVDGTFPNFAQVPLTCLACVR